MQVLIAKSLDAFCNCHTHDCSKQDDSDRAVGAYRAAARACAGAHYPPLYIAMEYIRTSNLGLADHFMAVARSLCGTSSTTTSTHNSSSSGSTTGNGAQALRTPGVATPAARSRTTAAAGAAAAAAGSSSDNSSSSEVPQDPLVLNEMGVLAYRRAEYESAADLFNAGTFIIVSLLIASTIVLLLRTVHRQHCERLHFGTSSVLPRCSNRAMHCYIRSSGA
jgi:hypothetical protein